MGRKQTEETKRIISEKLKEYYKKNLPKNIYTCESCGVVFESIKKIRKERKKHCEKCIRKVPHTKKIDSILECSKRTKMKIISRLNAKCSLCGWCESSCDLHHIIPKKENGNGKNNNLILVCPNCHRILHTIKDKYSINYLKERSFQNLYINWKDFYNTK